MEASLAFSLATAINVAAGAFVGVLAGVPVALFFYRRAAKHLDQVADGLARFLEEFARTSIGEDLRFEPTRDEDGRLTGGMIVKSEPVQLSSDESAQVHGTSGKVEETE